MVLIVTQRKRDIRPQKAFPATKLKPLEFRVYRTLKALGFGGERIVVACSGGLDSVALAHCLWRLSERLGLSLKIASIHHGPSEKADLLAYRKQAIGEVRALSRRMGAECEVVKSKLSLKSEADLREFRLTALERIRERCSAERIAFAHHADDLFETRMIRLIRGTGAQGFGAMSILGPRSIRPFLKETRAEIESYAREVGLKWCEDPSNQDLSPLRNWMRNSWFAHLEAKRQGARANLANSLERLSSQVKSENKGVKSLPLSRVELDRKRFTSLSEDERRTQLAALVYALGAKNFTARHIGEILKRLGSEKTRHSFTILSIDWRIDLRRIRAEVKEVAT